MIDLTPEARERFDEYLRRMRSAMRGTRAVEAAEVEQNVVEHVELALAGVPSPVGPGPLRAVLEQLGPPERWLPDEEQPFWKRAAERIMNGPEDWRLAYLTFTMTVLMFLLAPVGGIVLLVPAFLLARAHCALIEERGQSLGARRWLVLPPIWIAFVIFVFITMAGGVAATAAMAIENASFIIDGFGRHGVRYERVRIQAGLMLTAAGVWWIFLSGLYALLLPPVRKFFSPVLKGMRRVHLLYLTALGAVLLSVGVTLLWVV